MGYSDFLPKFYNFILTKSSRTVYRSRRLFFCKVIGSLNYVAYPLCKKSHWLRLCFCKRGHYTSAVLPTVCGFAFLSISLNASFCNLFICRSKERFALAYFFCNNTITSHLVDTFMTKNFRLAQKSQENFLSLRSRQSFIRKIKATSFGV